MPPCADRDVTYRIKKCSPTTLLRPVEYYFNDTTVCDVTSPKIPTLITTQTVRCDMLPPDSAEAGTLTTVIMAFAGVCVLAAVFLLTIVIVLSRKIKGGLVALMLRLVTLLGCVVAVISILFDIAEPTTLSCNMGRALHMLAFLLVGASLYPQAYRQGKVAKEELLLTSDLKLFYRALTITVSIAVLFAIGMALFPYEATDTSLAMGTPEVLVHEDHCASTHPEIQIVVLLLQVGWLATVLPHCMSALQHTLSVKKSKDKSRAVVDWTPGAAFLTLVFTVGMLTLLGMMNMDPLTVAYADAAFLIVGPVIVAVVIMKPVVEVVLCKKTSKRVRPKGGKGAGTTSEGSFGGSLGSSGTGFSLNTSASDAEGVKAMLRLPVVRAANQLYLIRQHVEERVEFEDRVDEFVALCKRPGVAQEEVRSCYVKIVAKFVKAGADMQVNLSEKCRTPLEYLAGDGVAPVTVNAFNKALKELQKADEEMFMKFVDTDLSAMSQQVTNWLSPFSDLDKRVKRGVIAQLSAFLEAEEAADVVL